MGDHIYLLYLCHVRDMVSIDFMSHNSQMNNMAVNSVNVNRSNRCRA